MTKAATKRGQRVLDFVLKHDFSGNDGAHGCEHALAVWKNGIALGKKLGADLELLEPALLLHDIVNPKSIGQARAQKHHALLSAGFASGFLPGLGYSQAETRGIMRIMVGHSTSQWTKRRTLEQKVIYDADKVDGAGKNAVKRALAVGRAHGWSRKKTAEWYLRRLLEVAGEKKLFTREGRKIAGKRSNESLAWCKKVLGPRFSSIMAECGG